MRQVTHHLTSTGLRNVSFCKVQMRNKGKTNRSLAALKVSLSTSYEGPSTRKRWWEFLESAMFSICSKPHVHTLPFLMDKFHPADNYCSNPPNYENICPLPKFKKLCMSIYIQVPRFSQVIYIAVMKLLCSHLFPFSFSPLLCSIPWQAYLFIRTPLV